jgi:hypothetical protein
MKVNKAIYLDFTGSNPAEFYINVNFPVKSIHVKSACLTAITDIVAGTELYYTLVSDLTNGEPIAQLYNSSAYSASQFCDVSFEPYKPINVNGTYKFTINNALGDMVSPSVIDCVVSMILEFNGVDTPSH